MCKYIFLNFVMFLRCFLAKKLKKYVVFVVINNTIDKTIYKLQFVLKFCPKSVNIQHFNPEVLN